MAKKKGITRRDFLKGVAGAAALGTGATFLPRKAHAAKRTLRIWHTEASAVAVKAVQKVCDKFEQLHPDVKVFAEGLGWAGLGTKLTTSIAAGNPPDITHIQPYMYRSLQIKGELVPVDDVYNHLGIDNIFEAVRDIAHYDGKYWGISHEVGTPVLLIRKDLAEKAGYKVPKDWTKPMFKTWDEEIEYLEAVTDPKKGQWGMSLPGTAYFLQEHCGRWVASNGGSFYDEKWNPVFDQDPFVGVLDFILTLSKKKIVPPDWLSQSWLGMIQEICLGKTTLIDHGYGRIALSIDKYAPGKASEDYFYPIWRPVGPLGEKSYTDLDAELWVVFSKSKNQDLAMEWLKLFYERDLYLNYIAQYPVHMYPITKSLANDPGYKALPELKQWKAWIDIQAEYISRKQALPVGIYAPHELHIPFVMEVFDSGIIVDEIVSVVQGRRNPKQAGQRMTERTKELIKKIGYPVPDPIKAAKSA
ncbi:MAG: sugar ABC transporter substrate-binding protein [Desulfobacterales bacterium]|nr:MAG: sugar ABC transporter substrate-binding protein [Desulfobacterales bacterium]